MVKSVRFLLLLIAFVSMQIVAWQLHALIKTEKFSVLLKALTVMAVTEVWISRANLSYGTDR